MPADRAFIKEWEATPPKGYPTLSPANVSGDEGGHQALHRDRRRRRLADAARRPAASGHVASGRVALLRERLLLSGDLRGGRRSQSFDFYVDKAVKRYQASNGLAPTGIVDKRTIAALNMPAAARLKQLKANLARLTEAAKSAAKRYVVVNIPAAQIESGARATASCRATPAWSASRTGRRRS